MSDKEQVEELKNKTKELVYVIKANVPYADYEIMMDWNVVCEAKSPEGFDDYRWGKIKYDHMFVKNFKPLMSQIIDELHTIAERLDNIEKKLIDKEIENGTKGLFK